MGLNVYSHAMARGMKEIVKRHAEMILKNRRIAAAAVEGIRYFFDFDSAVQLPMWGYPTRGAYYRDASSVDAVLAVRVPLFAINAEDDPISHYEALPFEEFQNNPYTVLCTTSCGGHIGWFESGEQRWFTKPVVSFLKALHDDIDWAKDFTFASQVPNPANSFEYNPVRRRMQPATSVYFPGQAEPI